MVDAPPLNERRAAESCMCLKQSGVPAATSRNVQSEVLREVGDGGSEEPPRMTI